MDNLSVERVRQQQHRMWRRQCALHTHQRQHHDTGEHVRNRHRHGEHVEFIFKKIRFSIQNFYNFYRKISTNFLTYFWHRFAEADMWRFVDEELKTDELQMNGEQFDEQLLRKGAEEGRREQDQSRDDHGHV